jgi:hypothetical protein
MTKNIYLNFMKLYKETYRPYGAQTTSACYGLLTCRADGTGVLIAIAVLKKELIAK